MWCCVGTGMENHGKYGELIYTHTENELYVNLFIASELDWAERGVRIIQETKFPDEESVRLTIRTEKPMKFKLLIRHPHWCLTGAMQAVLNGQDYAVLRFLPHT